MTDRYNHLTVALERDIREDDAEHLINAIMMLKGVLSVKGNVANSNSYTAEQRADEKWKTKLYNLMQENQ